MKAIILVAGYATRLYPLTKDKPKALLPINGKPILDYIMEEVNTIDAIDEVYVVSNHKFYDHFSQWAAGYRGKKPVIVIDDGTTTEENRRGGIGDIQYAIEQQSIDDDVAVIAGDNFFTFKLKEYYDFYRAKGMDCVCAKRLDDVEQLRQFAVATADEAGRIQELVEKPQEPQSNLAVFATYFYTSDTVRLFKQYLMEGNKPDAPGYFVQWLYTRKPVFIYEMNGDCFDIGTIKNYEEVQKMFS